MEYYRGFKIGGYSLSADEETELARLETVRRPVLVYGSGESSETASTLEDEVRELFGDDKYGRGGPGEDSVIIHDVTSVHDGVDIMNTTIENELMAMLESDIPAETMTLAEAEEDENISLADYQENNDRADENAMDVGPIDYNPANEGENFSLASFAT